MSTNPNSNCELLRKDLKLPDPVDFSVEIKEKVETSFENTKPLGNFLKEVMKLNPENFRVFGPDETKSNRLDATFEFGKHGWQKFYQKIAMKVISHHLGRLWSIFQNTQLKDGLKVIF